MTTVETFSAFRQLYLKGAATTTVPPTIEDERQMIGYLLGELSEEERARVEERFLRDTEYREALRAAEDDLVDEYVRGELPPRELALFEKSLTSLPRRRRMVEFARALAVALPEPTDSPEAVAVVRAPRPRRFSFLDSLRAPGWAFGFSLAALLLLAAGGWWLWNEARRERTRREGLQAEQQRRGTEDAGQAARVEPGGVAPGGVAPGEGQAANVDGRPQPGPGRPQQTPGPGKPTARRPVIASFVFAPGTARSGEEGRDIAVPEGAQILRLRLDLERGDEYRSYGAELRTAAGRPVWRNGALRPRSRKSRPSVVLDIPATDLTPGEYELTLTGTAGEGRPDVIGYYYFRLLKNKQAPR